MKIKKIRKIIVIRNDKIGDLVISSGIFRELKKEIPKSKITLITSKVCKPLVEKNKNIDEIIVLDYPPKKFVDFWRYFKLSNELRKKGFDLGIETRGSFITAFFFLWLARVKYRIGFYNNNLAKLFLHYPQKKQRSKPAAWNRIDLINKGLGLTSKNYWPDIAVDSLDKKNVDDIIRKNKLNKFICLLPFAAFEKKQLNKDKWEEITQYLLKNYKDHKIIILGTKIKKIDEFVRKNPGVIKLVPLNLRELYLLFQKSRLVIAHDGGPMHLAWAGNSNLIGIVADYINADFIPLGENSKMIKTDLKELGFESIKKEIDYFLN